MHFAQQQQQQGPQTLTAASATAAAVATVPTMKKASSVAAQTHYHHTPPPKPSTGDATVRPQNEYYSTVVARRPSMTGCDPGSGPASKTSNLSMRHSASGATKLERKDKHGKSWVP
ncbi:unnamed protein product [Strongylus vulgaris]|uniref:Uncharacterized protein n=1 Tax=Strongylus vulgaris TaxID=40348 RepID=A0A3P7JIL8_STRVU|nr:unnamed protein product [Strongylus vulgaris]